MSSTGKTKNLGLCQWALSDPFLMEDFNEVLRKIDAAVDDVISRRLFTVKITGPTPSIVLDCSELDISQYAELEIRTSTVDNSNKSLRVNGVSAEKYNFFYTGGSYKTDKATLPAGCCKLSVQPSRFRLELYYGDNTYYMDKSDFPQIRSIEIFGSSTTNNFTVGDVITVWGVKK